MSVELRTALESLVTAVNRYSTPHDIVDGCMRGRIDGDAWSQSWNAIRSAKAEAERVLEAHVSPQAHSEKGSRARPSTGPIRGSEMNTTIERAAFAAFKSDFIGHRGETAEGEWKRFAGTGYHKRWLIMTRAALAETFDTTGDEMWEAVQAAAEKALREDVDDPGLAITRAVFDAMSKLAASPAPAPKEE